MISAVDLLLLYIFIGRPQGPRGLRRRSAPARFQRLRVRIPARKKGSLSVLSVVCCQVEVSVTSGSFVQEESYLMCVCVCVCVCAWVWSGNLYNEEALAQNGALAPWKNIRVLGVVSYTNKLFISVARYKFNKPQSRVFLSWIILPMVDEAV